VVDSSGEREHLRHTLRSVGRGQMDQPIFFAVMTILSLTFLYLVVLALSNADIAAALPVVVATLGAGVLALYGWNRDRVAAAEAMDQERRAHLHNRRLRRQLVELHRAREALADPSDVPAMVVQIAMSLLEAEKGFLLVPDPDAEPSAPGAPPPMKVLSALGFSEEGSAAAIASELAAQAMDADHALRQELPVAAPDGERGNGDGERVRNLVAVPTYIFDDLRGVVVCANREGGFASFDDDVLLALGDQAGAVLENGRMQSQMRDSYIAVVRMLAETIKVKDPSLRNHSDEVSDFVLTVANRLRLPGEQRERLRFGSLLHDVGKIAISEQILLKPGPLTEDERRIVELHPLIGSRLVREVPALQPLADVILHHHERWDGGGYPGGISHENIPLESRIIAVADSFSAMTAARPYRPAMSVADACLELERCSGSMFDPRIVEVFVEAVRRAPPHATEQAVQAAMDDPEVRRRVRVGTSATLLGFVTGAQASERSGAHLSPVRSAPAAQS